MKYASERDPSYVDIYRWSVNFPISHAAFLLHDIAGILDTVRYRYNASIFSNILTKCSPYTLAH